MCNEICIIQYALPIIVMMALWWLVYLDTMYNYMLLKCIIKLQLYIFSSNHQSMNKTNTDLMILVWQSSSGGLSTLWILESQQYETIYGWKIFCVILYVRFSIFDSVSFLLKFKFLFNKIHGLFDFKMS